MNRTATKRIYYSFILFFLCFGKLIAQPGIGIPFGFTPSTPVVVPPAFAGAIVTASAQDNSMIILSPAGFNFPFAGTTYPYLLTSTNGWVALLSASDLSASVVTTTDSVAVVSADSSVTVPNAALASISVGMFVSGTNILANGGYAQVINVDLVTKKVKLNVRFTAAVAAGAGTFNFFNLIPVYFNSSLPANQLSTYAGARPFITPLWDDLATSSFAYNLTGSVYSIRWTSKWDKANAAANNLCWLRFDATPGATYGNIGFNYYNQAYTTAGTPSASIGIAGVCTGDYYSVRPTAPTTAAYDSTSSSDTLSGQGAGSLRFNNFSILWNPFSPNDNCSGTRLPTDLGFITSSCSFISASNVNATTSGSGMSCAAAEVKDVWFKFTKPPGVTSVIITTAPGSCQPSPGTTIEAWTSCGGTMLGCTTSGTTYPTFGELTLYRPSCNTEVIYVRVTGDGDAIGKFDICAKTNGNPPSPTGGTTCGNPTNICSLPYTQTGMTTAGSGNEYDSTNAQCHDPYLNGEDYVFSYTPTTNICVRVQLTSAGVNPSVFVYDGCPDLGTTHCISSVAGTTGIIRINSISLVAGVTYYFLVDNNPLNATNNIPFDISITSLGTSQAYDPCASAFNLGNVPNNMACSFGTYSTECSQPSATVGYPTPTCGGFIDGVTGDVWFKFTATFSGSLLIKTQPSATNPTNDAAMTVYTGTCGAFTLFACDDNSAGNSLPLLSLPVINGTTYYIRVWTVNPSNTGNFDLCLSSACSPPNDLPCSAVYVPLGGTAAGYNTCSGANNEPPNSAQCVVGGIVNTVWYKAVVPAGGSIRIRTHPLTLTDTQIQAFTFGSGCANAATIYTSKGCNDDGPDCGAQSAQSFHDYSELVLSGQTPGDTIFVAVDGYNSMTGTFEITFIDGSSAAYSPVYLQDCAFPAEVCGATNITVPDPGPLNFGNICDFTPTYDCWQNGERNSMWYRVTVNPGTLQFAVNSVTDYDFIMWDVTGVSNACALILTHSIPSIRCNWVTTTGQTGISIPDPNNSWEPAITSATPRTYLILIDNWNPPSFQTGFTLDWMGSPIASNPSSVTWNGGADTSFNTVSNWGTAPCNALPSCTIDANITASASGRQPTMTVNTQVKNLVINSGASLRIKTGVILDVCGDFTNNGTFIAEPGSTVRFSGTGSQAINGSLLSPNSFANLTIFKATGQVNLNANIDVSQNFTTISATSIFNINGKYMKVGGDFLNNTGNTTFTGIGNSTVEFNGSINQNFTNTNSTFNFNRMKMNKLSGKLYLIGANSKITIDTVLTMARGIIVTRSNAVLEIYLKYNISAAVIGHSALSYIDGRLRRAVYNASLPISIPFSLDFPVGDSLTPGGYELANVTFLSGTVIPDILCYFGPWPGMTPPALGPTAAECLYATYDALPMFNHGFWTFSKTATSPFNGVYNITLSNTGQSNNTGMGWTVAKADIAANASLSASWSLIGQCVISSTPGSTQRVNFNSPASIATSFNSLITTVQSTQPLPIELLSFTAEPDGEKVICKWETASETNNDYFDVQKSLDGETWESIGLVRGFGAGTSTMNHFYKLIDPEKCLGIRYYRLKQVDIDEHFGFSETVALNCRINTNEISVYPNPGSNDIIYTFYESKKGEAIIQFIDMLGKIVLSETVITQKGFNPIHTSVNELPNGVYYLRIKSTGNSEQTDRQIRFVKE